MSAPRYGSAGRTVSDSSARCPRGRGTNVIDDSTKRALSTVPAVTLGFWIIMILATTLGETGGDTVTMTLKWGYPAGVALFGVALVVLVVPQIVATRFHRYLYWSTIVASTTFGTVMADFADRTLGIGYAGGSSLLLLCLVAVLGLWYWSQGTGAVNTVSSPKVGAFYWATITFSQTLGTALGDWVADKGGLGYEGGALVFAAGLAVVAALFYWSSISRVALFWVAFILSRPLGATVGDFLDKPKSLGGLNLSRPLASAVIAALIVVLIVVLPQRAGRHQGVARQRAGVASDRRHVVGLEHELQPQGGGGQLDPDARGVVVDSHVLRPKSSPCEEAIRWWLTLTRQPQWRNARSHAAIVVTAMSGIAVATVASLLLILLHGT